MAGSPPAQGHSRVSTGPAGPADPKSSSQMRPRMALALLAYLHFLPSPKGLEVSSPVSLGALTGAKIDT